MRLLLVGSGEFGLPTFERLRLRHAVVGVITQPDRPAGRGRHLQGTPVASWAAEHGLAAHKAADANDPQMVWWVRELAPEVSVVIAFGQKLAPQLVEAMGALAVNLHASLLPKYRGAAPINWAVINGDQETGVTVISLAQRMDAGLIYGQTRTAIGELETAGELHDRLAGLGPELVESVLARQAEGNLRGLPQDEALASRAPKLSRDAAGVDFSADSRSVRCRIHGLTPWPGVTLRCLPSAGQAGGYPLKVLRVREVAGEGGEPAGTLVRAGANGLGVACGRGAVELLEVQRAGGRAMGLAEFLRGNRLEPGDRLV